MIANAELDILDRIVEPQNDNLAPEAARGILELRFPESDVRRMNDLSAKARAGTLSTDERAELESYNFVGHVLALLHSKARLALKRNGLQA